ncbi:hypothetical protein L7F22_016641 [Adiantum nelumboides]|nr:hypothetical protein [Adiantum nelumboides]
MEEPIEKMLARQSFQNAWHTDLLGAITADLPYFCFVLWCAPCASYDLRRRALYGDMSRYVCCAGHTPCSGYCGESECPELCLITEVMCCFPFSVHSTRFLLQDEFNIKTTKCDNCIIAFAIFLRRAACIFRVFAAFVPNLRDASRLLTHLANGVYCIVCGCIQTQHKVELDKRDGKLGQTQAPTVQQMSRFDRAGATISGV